MRAPCEIRHIDLSRRIEPLELADGHNGLLTVFWFGTMPLGQRLFDAGELPLPAPAIADIAAQTTAGVVGSYVLDADPPPSDGERLDRIIRATPLATLDLALEQRARRVVRLRASIIVPTRNRPDRLARCLASLDRTCSLIHETIVVDNGSVGDATREVVASSPGVAYVFEPRPGSSIARNTGARYATGDVLAFIDDDVVGHAGWPASLLAEFTDPEIACVTGLILPLELTTDAQLVFEQQMGFGRGFLPITYDEVFFAQTRRSGVPVWRLGGSGNMAIRRDVFLANGGFDERLGHGPNAAGCSEDSELWYRMLASGMKCRYAPAAVVYHEHRRGRASLRRQLYSYMRGHAAALLIQFEKHGDWGNIRRLAMHLPYTYGRRLLDQIVRHPRRQPILLPEVAGVLAGIVFYVRCRLQKRHGNESSGSDDAGREAGITTGGSAPGRRCGA